MARDVIADLVAQISIDGTKFDKGIGQVNRQLKTVREELKTASTRFKQTGDNADFLASKSQTLSGKLKLQKTQVEILNKAYNESVNNTGEFSKQSQNLATKLERAKRGLMETESELKDVNEQLKNLPNRWQLAGQQAQAAGEKMMTAGRNMTSFGQSYTMGVTAPIVAGATAVFKASMDYESAFAGVAKTFSGTEQQLAALSDGIRQMAKEIPASTTEIAAVAEAAGQLGIKTESIEGFTRTMIDLGEATNMTADQAATEFARFANIVGMSQENFDRLGSSTVALGNSMATTEAEISSMAMRLAAQGSLVGMTEAQILALSATMSSLGIEAEAGGTAMTTVLKKIDQAVGEGGKALQGFAKAAGSSSSEFSKAWQSDPIKALDMFIKGLSNSSAEGKNLTTILTDLGIKGIREADTILRMAGASDLLTNAVSTSTKAWEENTALSDEAAQRYKTTESQLKIMWNRVKDVAITLGDALAPAIMDVLDAAEPLIEQIESGAKAFSELDEEQQRTILKFIALAAAIGPVSIGLGGLTTTIGGIVKVGGGLFNLLGRAGGNGLLARIAGLGLGGPVGLAIAGVTAMSSAYNYLTEDTKNLYDATFEKVRQMDEEIQATDELIAKFGELQSQNRLTSDEMLEYMDILDRLSSTSSPDKIADLTERQNELLEKSGFTNTEMEEFLGLNDKIIEQAPNAAKAISDQGNAYADNLQALKDLNAEKRNEMMMEAEVQLLEGLRDERDLLAEQVRLQREKNEAFNEHQTKHDNYIVALTTVNELTGQRSELEAEIAELQSQGLSDESEEIQAIAEQIAKLSDKQVIAEKDLEIAKESLDTAKETLDTKDKELGKVNDELKRLDDLKYEYEALWIAHLDINAEKGKGIKAIDEEISRLRDSKREMEENNHELVKNTEEYRNAQKEIDKQISKLEKAKGELEKINKLAAESPYEKTMILNTQPSIAKINQEIADTVYKRVSVGVDARYAQRLAYKDGTDFHPGGKALVGEEGPELARLGNRWSLLDFGVKDLPVGTQVFTNRETRKILSALNQIPAYATGVSPTGEANRIISSLNDSSPSQPVLIEVHVTSEMDSREVGKGVARVVTEIQNRDKRVRESFA